MIHHSFKQYEAGSDEVFKIKAKRLLEGPAVFPAALYEPGKWELKTNESVESLSFFNPNEEVILEGKAYEDGEVVLFSNHDWFAVYVFARAFLLNHEGNALDFRYFLTIESGWVRDPGMAEVFRLKIQNTPGSGMGPERVIHF